MPANLPPQYHEAEQRYRLAKTSPEKILALTEMLAIMPKHKGTDKLRASLRAKIARLSQEEEKRARVFNRYLVKKEGAGQAMLVGLPNAGKSSVFSSLCGVPSRVSSYPFTTTSPLPGMMKFEDIQIQLVDMPPVTGDQPWLSDVLHSPDLLIIVVDLSLDPLSQLEEVEQRLQKLRVEKRRMVLGNKSDLPGAEKNSGLLQKRYGEDLPLAFISADSGRGIEEARAKIYQALSIIRVYTKVPGGKPEFRDPAVLSYGSTVADFAGSIHKDFAQKLKYALLWGSGKYDGQRVGKDHILKDQDIVELHI
jgi:hypothetical protein